MAFCRCAERVRAVRLLLPTPHISHTRLPCAVFLQRRRYWLLQAGQDHRVLVHYLDNPPPRMPVRCALWAVFETGNTAPILTNDSLLCPRRRSLPETRLLTLSTSKESWRTCWMRSTPPQAPSLSMHPRGRMRPHLCRARPRGRALLGRRAPLPRFVPGLCLAMPPRCVPTALLPLLQEPQAPAQPGAAAPDDRAGASMGKDCAPVRSSTLCAPSLMLSAHSSAGCCVPTLAPMPHPQADETDVNRFLTQAKEIERDIPNMREDLEKAERKAVELCEAAALAESGVQPCDIAVDAERDAVREAQRQLQAHSEALVKQERLAEERRTLAATTRQAFDAAERKAKKLKTQLEVAVKFVAVNGAQP